MFIVVVLRHSGERSTGTVVDNDSDNGGVCDADEIAGCQDATAYAMCKCYG